MTHVAGAPLQPMLATTGELPAGQDWVFEFKWDGVRAVAVTGRKGLRLWARSGVEITVAYPELAAFDDARDLLLDGELVVLDQAGRPSFQALAERMHVRQASRAAKLAATVPVTLMIFDLLRFEGLDLTPLPYAERRAALESLGLGGPHWLVPPIFSDGTATEAAARENKLEGVVAKRRNSIYRPGTRSPDWIKWKVEQTEDLVVGGWRPGVRRLGGLLLGRPLRDGRLHFAGRVGGGISGPSERALLAALRPLHSTTSPFVEALPREDAKDANWVRPELVVEVKYAQVTPDGRLRFPRFVGLRPDKTVEECMPEGDDA